MEIIRLTPVLKEMIWGGDKLKNEFGYDCADSGVGECWGISAHPNGDCTIDGGTFAGKKLSEVYEANRNLFGNISSDNFPLLTKIIDAKNDLSIQVHPDDTYAFKNENGSLGKTECWYVIDAEPNATIVIGHNAKDKAEVASMIDEKRWKDFIREIPVKKGDFFQINPGTVHAIKGGTLILETQQNSDITYRVYDYDRLQDGKPRQLHIEKSKDVISAPFVPEMVMNEQISQSEDSRGSKLSMLVGCNYYIVWKCTVDGMISFDMSMPFMLASVIDGAGSISGVSGDYKLKKGDHFIIPNGFGEVAFIGKMEIILSSPS